MQPSLFTLAHHDGERRARVSTRRELRPTIRQLVPLDLAARTQRSR
jgi:hypothetical protein